MCTFLVIQALNCSVGFRRSKISILDDHKTHPVSCFVPSIRLRDQRISEDVSYHISVYFSFSLNLFLVLDFEGHKVLRLVVPKDYRILIEKIS